MEEKSKPTIIHVIITQNGWATGMMIVNSKLPIEALLTRGAFASVAKMLGLRVPWWWWKSRIVRAIQATAGTHALTADIDDALSQAESRAGL